MVSTVNATSSVRWGKNPNTVAQAIAFAEAETQRGSARWYRMCLAFVARCYGLPASGTPYAVDMWSAVPADMRHADRSGIPPGALLVYRTSSRAGHIALYAGGGVVYSNDIKRNGYIDRVTFDDLVGGIWNLDYLGWIPPYFPAAPASSILSQYSISTPPGTTPTPPATGGSGVPPLGGDPANTVDQSAGLDALNSALGWAGNKQNWFNLLMIIIGALLIIIALYRMGQDQLTGLVRKLAPAAQAVATKGKTLP